MRHELTTPVSYMLISYVTQVFLDQPQKFNDIVLRLCGIENPLPAPKLPQPQTETAADVAVTESIPISANGHGVAPDPAHVVASEDIAISVKA